MCINTISFRILTIQRVEFVCTQRVRQHLHHAALGFVFWAAIFRRRKCICKMLRSTSSSLIVCGISCSFAAGVQTTHRRRAVRSNNRSVQKSGGLHIKRNIIRMRQAIWRRRTKSHYTARSVVYSVQWRSRQKVTFLFDIDTQLHCVNRKPPTFARTFLKKTHYALETVMWI